jgi:hypothetical protein
VTPPERPPLWTGPKPKAAQFGDAGQFALLAGSTIGLSREWLGNDGGDTFAVTFDPSLEYFVVKNVSVGAEIDLAYSNIHSNGTDVSSHTETTQLGAGLHLGVNIPLGRWFSLYPLFKVGLRHTEVKQTVDFNRASFTGFVEVPGPIDTIQFGPWVSGQIPVLYHPIDHFFVGVGPTVLHDFSHLKVNGQTNGQELTALGAKFVLGGYFDLQSHPETENDLRPVFDRPPVEHRVFGDPGVVVITEENAFAYSSYSGASSTTSWALAGGFDWFFARSQSLGLTASYTQASTPIPDSNSSDRRDSVGFGGRYGYSFPITPWLSIYPRASLTYSVSTTEFVVPSSEPRVLAAGLYVPALFHLAPHFFAGIGPAFRQDIVHAQDSGPQTRGTSIGASSLIGCWL